MSRWRAFCSGGRSNEITGTFSASNSTLTVYKMFTPQQVAALPIAGNTTMFSGDFGTGTGGINAGGGTYNLSAASTGVVRFENGALANGRFTATSGFYDMFTNFPGNSGETVRISVAPEQNARR